MKKLLLVLLLTGCASFQVSTLNHDPIYSIEGSDAEITVINNEFELQRLLEMILILDMTLLNMQNLSLYHLIGIIEY